MGQLYVTGDTFFKRTPGQSSTLPPEDKVFISKGESLQYIDSSLRTTGEHYQVETVDQIAPWGRSGFFYSSHILLEVGRFASRIVRYCSLDENYSSILREAQRIRGAEDNTCVAFQSEALRRLGIRVPVKDSYGNTSPISLVTRPYSRWLSDNLGPEKVSNYSKLQPGDLCFSSDAPGHPGFPAHTYIFESFYDAKKAYVIDNRASRYIRNLGSGPRTPFAYALRIDSRYTFGLLQYMLTEQSAISYYEASADIQTIPEYVHDDSMLKNTVNDGLPGEQLF